MKIEEIRSQARQSLPFFGEKSMRGGMYGDPDKAVTLRKLALTKFKERSAGK